MGGTKRFVRIGLVCVWMVFLMFNQEIRIVNKERTKWENKFCVEIDASSVERNEQYISVRTINGVALKVPWHNVESIQGWEDK
jgi:hypothetical protein